VPLTTIRTIYSSGWEERRTEAGALLVYRVRGSGFLHHMVRNLVGTVLEVGRGKLHASQIPEILAARSRDAAGPTARLGGCFWSRWSMASKWTDHRLTSEMCLAKCVRLLLTIPATLKPAAWRFPPPTRPFRR